MAARAQIAGRQILLAEAKYHERLGAVDVADVQALERVPYDVKKAAVQPLDEFDGLETRPA